MTVTIRKVPGPEFARAMRSLQKLGRTDVLVGIPKGEVAGDSASTSLAVRGYIHDTGAPEAGIPRREWLRPGVNSVRDKWLAHLKSAAAAAVRNDDVSQATELKRAGTEAANGCRMYIRSQPAAWAQRNPAYDARQRARGRVNTLIDDGDMMRAINYLVEQT